jgi:hypothetical protein
MPFDFQRARPLLQNGNLAQLFVEELGWEPSRQKLTLRAAETDHAFTAIAEKRGFTAWVCTRADGHLPDHTTRLKLDRALTQTSFEHLIVFATQDYAQQSWVWVRREPGRPLSARTHEFNRAQPGDSLLQKLQTLFVSLEEEEKGELSTITIAERARAAFDIERVTKAFYRDFDTHRKAFLKFIDGIGEVADREWYASVMLNRLMFVYFIQRKGFLDADPAYLRNRLLRCQQEKGKDKFYTFYRYFLLRLFHEGFGKRRKDRAPDLEKLRRLLRDAGHDPPHAHAIRWRDAVHFRHERCRDGFGDAVRDQGFRRVNAHPGRVGVHFLLQLMNQLLAFAGHGVGGDAAGRADQTGERELTK